MPQDYATSRLYDRKCDRTVRAEGYVTVKRRGLCEHQGCSIDKSLRLNTQLIVKVTAGLNASNQITRQRFIHCSCHTSLPV